MVSFSSTVKLLAYSNIKASEKKTEFVGNSQLMKNSLLHLQVLKYCFGNDVDSTKGMTTNFNKDFNTDKNRKSCLG